jgi:hypothetical protein
VKTVSILTPCFNEKAAVIGIVAGLQDPPEIIPEPGLPKTESAASGK